MPCRDHRDRNGYNPGSCPERIIPEMTYATQALPKQRRRPDRLPGLIAAFTLCLLPAVTTQADTLDRDEQILFFPTSTYIDAGSNEWVVPIHGWVFEMEEDSIWRRMVLDILPALLEAEPDASNRAIFEQRGRMFLVDNERNKQVDIASGDVLGTMAPSQANGHFRGTLRIPVGGDARTEESSWLEYRARLPEGDSRVFSGRSQLVGPEGVSVISDIDDTIKISNVADRQALLTNTFLEPSRAVEGMSVRYQKWASQGAVFHYVSASPWQLYPTLAEFLTNKGFPAGSFHLKSFRIKDETFFDLFGDQWEYKRPLIEKILATWPQRRFVLIGDGGEQDPEIFADIARSHPNQVLRIYIRDTAADRTSDPRYRTLFAGMPEGHWKLFTNGDELPDLY